MGVLRKINEAVKAKDLKELMGGEIMGNPSKWPEGNGLKVFTVPNKENMRVKGTVKHINADTIDRGNALAYEEAARYEKVYDCHDDYGCYADDDDDADCFYD